jgi:hypothetical protein
MYRERNIQIDLPCVGMHELVQRFAHSMHNNNAEQNAAHADQMERLCELL